MGGRRGVNLGTNWLRACGLYGAWALGVYEAVLGLCVYTWECVANRLWTLPGRREISKTVCVHVCVTGRERFYPQGMVACACACNM